MKHLLIVAAALLCACSSTGGKAPIAIIPQPASMADLGGELNVADTIGRVKTEIDTTIAHEGYTLRVDGDGVYIAASSDAGFQYAQTTLDQLSTNGVIPFVEIKDAPRFAWRAVMLDVARHFQPKAYVLKFIDILAYHKINKLHFHLTDGIGWRVEIDGYPQLTQRGAWRKIKDESVPFIGYEQSEQGRDSTYGGYYTKEDIAQIVAYAASRNIEIIPEIEMPGHSMAALAAYPELLCVGSQKGGDVYCAGNPNTYKMLEGVLDEIIEMFPSPYIHIGGDEVGVTQWENCPLCRKISSKGSEVQKHFVRKMESYVASKGRRMIGWDEVASDGLSSSAIVMSWTGWESGMAAAKAGYDVIMCPLHYVYLDHYQAQHDSEPQAWGGDNSLRRVWSFDVVPKELDAQFAHKIIGGQGNLWTETISDTSHLEYMLLPRLAALSEALWTKERSMDSSAWNDFVRRIDVQFNRYDSKGWNWARSAIAPSIKQQGDTITLVNELNIYPIHYTLDGSEPTANSPRYEAPFVLNSPTTLRAVALRNGQKAGNELRINNLHHKATGAKVNYTTTPNAQYNGGNANALTDNLYATKRGDHRAWVGFEGQNMDVELNFDAVQEISAVTLRFFQHSSTTSVVLPTALKIWARGQNDTWQEVYAAKIEPQTELNAFTETIHATFPARAAKALRVEAINIGKLPASHPKSGANAWVFVDEIAVL